jgi:uncharacterized protein
MIVDVTFNHHTHGEIYHSPHLAFRGESRRGPFTGENRTLDLDALVAGMDAAGVDRTGVLASVVAVDFGRGGRGPIVADVDVDTLAKALAPHGDRLFGWVSIHPFGRMDTLRMIEHAVRDLGFKGVQVFPHWFALPVDDRLYYPIYAKCAELGVPIAMQIGMAGGGSSPKVVASPMQLDDVLFDFPELSVLGLHLGDPWQADFLALARNHLNLSLVGDVAPARWSPGVVEELRSAPANFAAENHVAARFLWGTNGRPGTERTVAEDFLRQARELDLPPEVTAAVLGGNAAWILGLGDDAG